MGVENLDNKGELMRFIRDQLESEPLPLDAVEGLEQAAVPGRWEALNPLNGFADIGGGFAPLAYRTVPGGGIELRGGLTKPAGVGGPIAVAKLPKGAAPKETLIFGQAAVEAGEPFLAEILINPAGEVIWNIPPAASVERLSLAGIRFGAGS